MQTAGGGRRVDREVWRDESSGELLYQHVLLYQRRTFVPDSETCRNYVHQNLGSSWNGMPGMETL